ncbi:putative deoxyribonuclease tatdn3 isoform X1 [Acipenser oxyrinchus oxyrinchus]|uniref:Deoxyribonuclease tatdn3 isoform X1 n=1 Tax=Acipenser oxyrinchus oxyrinchus TaxID=40147 RepID=A0AAD8GA94_ACIOX|nr:putative deoxyribonuclease tatdn3 isoform X1 [Acipenser oxyrinchus oxyrinchus]
MAAGFIDCHCHISAEEFAEDVGDVIKRAKEAGVKALVSVTEHADEFEKVIQLHKRYPDFVVPCFGIHPFQGCAPQLQQHSVTMQDLEPALPFFQKYKDEIAAVGEIGLDFTPWYAPHSEQRDEQQRVFRSQLDIAKQLGLPVVSHQTSNSHKVMTLYSIPEHSLHCRFASFPEGIRGIQHALLHNFAGKPSVAMEGVQAGYFFSFPPAVSRNEQRVKLVKQIPLEHICLETDSPALGLDKEVRNEPKNITISCEYIAKVKGVTPERVAEISTQNALKLFPRIHRTVKCLQEAL